MSKPKRTFTAEFKRDAIAMAERGDRSVAQIERDLGVSAGCLRHGRAQARRAAAAGTTVDHLAEQARELQRLRRENVRLRAQREILKKAVAMTQRVPRASITERYRWRAAQRTSHPVQRLCTAFGVAPSGLDAWLKRPASVRMMADQQQLVALAAIHTTTGQRYGSRRLRAALAVDGPTLSRDHIRRLMRLGHIHPVRTRRQRRRGAARTIREQVVANVLDRQFAVAVPNTWWLGDITTIATDEGDLHLAGILDLGGRTLVGWATAATQTTDLAVTAFQSALQRQGGGPSAGHHTDQGVQYTSRTYQALVTGAGVTMSMSRPGCCLDNAPMESFWATLKNELTHHRQYTTRAEAHLDVFWYIEVFYHRQRLHSALGYQSPASYLVQWHHDNQPVHQTQT